MQFKLALLLFICMQVTRGDILKEKDQDVLGKNLKIMRKDFNKLIENVEDFLADFVKQIQDAEKMVENVYTNDDDYNWEENSSTGKPQIKKEKYVAHFTSPPLSNTILQSSPELSNDIETRKKRDLDPNNLRNMGDAGGSIVPNEASFPAAGRIRNQEEQLVSPNQNQLSISDLPLGSSQGQGYENHSARQSVSKEAPLDYQVNSNEKIGYKNTPICTAQTQEEKELEKQKFEELKAEVKKLSELVSLLKDQQKMINEMSKGGTSVNDHVKDDANSLESSYLYNALKHLQMKQDARRIKVDRLDDMQNDFSTIEFNLQNHSTSEIEKIKADLKQTEQHLSETKGLVNKEKEKEAVLESELKRQNREIKLLKALMENLYDKSNMEKVRKPNNDSGFRKSDFEDIDLDSVLGIAHTPKPWPWSKTPQPQKQNQGKKDASARDKKIIMNRLYQMVTPRSEPSSFSDSSPNLESLSTARNMALEDKLRDFFQKIHETYPLYGSDYETELFNNETISALMQLTKTDADRFKKFNLTSTRESSLGEKKDKKMYTPLSILNNSDQYDQKTPTEGNETLSTARANENSKLDELQFKLKLIDLLTDEDQGSNINNGHKKINQSIQKLLLPQKKSEDDETLQALKILLNERDKPQKTEVSLSELLKGLNEKPQPKIDDSNIEAELKELQRAINNLRPRDDTFNSFDLENGIKRKEDFQSLLNQAISQNEANLNSVSPQATLTVATGADSVDKNSLATQQFVSQGNPAQLARLENLIKSYAVTQYGNQLALPQPASAIPLAPNSNVYGFSPLISTYKNGFNPNSNWYPFIPNVYNPNVNAYTIQPNVNPYAYIALNPVPVSSTYDGTSTSSATKPAYSSVAQNYNLNLNVPTAFGSYPSNKYSQHPAINKYGSSTYGLTPPFSSIYPQFTYYPSKVPPGQSNSEYGENFVKTMPYSQAYSNDNNYVNYEKTFRQPTGAYQEHNYDSNGYSGPSLDQPFGYRQNSAGNKYLIVSDLTQQIQNLENIVTGLTTRAGYAQTADDTASIMTLQQRIYNLKEVIKSLNDTPKHYGPPQEFQLNPQASGVDYQNPAPQQPYQIKSELSSPYSGPRGPSYNTQNQFKQSPAIPPYRSGINQQVEYSSSNPPLQTSQLISEQTPPPPPLSPQPTSYQASGDQPSNPTYQSKETTEEGRKRIMYPTKFDTNVGDLKYLETKRSKRQTEGKELLAPREYINENGGRFQMRQDDNKERQAGYDLGEDTFTQLGNVFKKYLEENMSEPREHEMSESRQNKQSRNIVLNKLQQKLDELKLQLESQKQLATPLHDISTLPVMYDNGPALTSYDNQYISKYPKAYYNGINHSPIQTFVSSKRSDHFTEFLMKILEKIGDSLPQLSSRLFGNIVTDIGNSNGDDYSGLQTVLKNLGRIGFIPIVLVKILESAGIIFKQLGKNPLFRQFLLPALILGLIAGAVLFLIFFFQQDEPHGYIGYQQSSHPNRYPQYESSHENHYNLGTSPSYNTYRQADVSIYRPTSDVILNNELRNDIQVEPLLNGPQNRDLRNDRNGFYERDKFQYSRGYYDYDKGYR